MARVVDTIEALRVARRELRGRVGLVTTMGALHAGHLSLVEAARAESDSVLATIFVNPAQFGAGEDLDSYPRDLPRDLAMLENLGVDLVFTPSQQLMYPSGFQTTVDVKEVASRLEGAQRPRHFQGVATVVAKLFNLAQADAAYFGQKDAQQVVVIRRMARDLNFPLEIVVCPTIRETDGLALSSRNAYLNQEQRRAAAALYRALRAAALAYEAGERDPEALRAIARAVLAAEPLAAVAYVSVADPVTLEECATLDEKAALMSLAARVGQPRLIDNCLLPFALNVRDGLTATLGAQ